jgi:hypothetical protein
MVALEAFGVAWLVKGKQFLGRKGRGQRIEPREQRAGGKV